MGDRVAVLRGRPPAMRQAPGSLRPARQPLRRRLHGLAGDESLRGPIGESADAVFLGSQRIALSLERTLRPGLKAYPSRTVIVGIRPEDLSVSLEEFGSSEAPGLVGEVELVEALGSELLVHFATDAPRSPPRVCWTRTPQA